MTPEEQTRSDETAATDEVRLEGEQTAEQEADASLQNLFTLGIIAAIGIAFLAVCLPLFIL